MVVLVARVNVACPMPRREEPFEQQERAEQSRWAAKSARWDGLLTFDAKGEIIIFIERFAVAADFISFVPFVRIYSSYIIGSCLAHS
jgi:hypothetical protein